MTDKLIPLRAHHGLCMTFFEGKGYSEEFVTHMTAVLQNMQTNPTLKLIADADIICSKCPNLEKGSCRTADLVDTYDKKVLTLCELQENETIDWNTFSSLVTEKILIPGKRSTICENCEWNEICSAKE